MATQTDPLPALLNAAMNARRQGQVKEEARLLDQALRLAPADPRVLNSRGMAALAAKDFEVARQSFAAATQADPGAPALWINLATAARALGDEKGEAESLEGALAIDRRHFTAHLRLAELRQRQGDVAGAALHWSAIVQMAAGMTDRPPQVEEAATRGQRFLAERSVFLQQQLDVSVGEGLAKLGADARRFQACVDAALRGRPIYHNQCSGVHFPFLPADEFFDSRHFPWFSELEAATDAIRREALGLVKHGTPSIRPYVNQDAGTPFNKWSTLNNSLDWSACFLWEYGARNDPVCELCPETAAILDKLPLCPIPGKAPTAFFSILKPGAHIPPHTGVTNTRAIVHLPLVVPPGCEFRVGAETRPWVEGKAFAFDDTIEHEAWNRSGEVRIVLIFDVWNPHITQDERMLLSNFFQIVDQPRET
jgi:aspartyl/asparaginyl beta-hydroxylase (cupin superfamily)